MAKKDVEKYFIAKQVQFVKMSALLPEVQRGIDEGFLPEERLQEMEKRIIDLQNDYERLGYIMFLLNQPVRKEKKAKEKRQNKKYYDAMSHCSQEAIEKDGEDTLKYFKEFILEADKKRKEKEKDDK